MHQESYIIYCSIINHVNYHVYCESYIEYNYIEVFAKSRLKFYG